MLFGVLLAVTGAQPTLLQMFHAWGWLTQLHIKTCVRVDPLCSVFIHTLCYFCGNAAFSLLFCGSSFLLLSVKLAKNMKKSITNSSVRKAQVQAHLRDVRVPCRPFPQYPAGKDLLSHHKKPLSWWSVFLLDWQINSDVFLESWNSIKT